MKKLQKLIALCLIFVSLTTTFIGCSKNNNSSPEDSTENSFTVSHSSEITIEVENSQLISKAENTLKVQKNAKIKPTLKAEQDSIFNTIIINGEKYASGSEIEVSENLSIKSFADNVKPVGVALYQNTPNNTTWNKILSFQDYAKITISSNNGMLSSSDKFLFYISKTDSTFKSNTTFNHTQTENELEFNVELYYETTEVCVIIIFADTNNNLYYQEIETMPINFETKNTFSISTIKQNAINSITTIKVNFSNNISTKK